MGIRVSATMSENTSANVTVSAWSRNSCPAIPLMKTIGKNTAIVVSVAAVTAVATSAVPLRAASSTSWPSSFFADDVFQDNNRVVHKHAHGERNAAE